MEAGPQLDSMIARQLFGSVVIIDTQSGESYMMGHDREPQPIPPYSTDLDAAYLIAEYMLDYDHELKAKNAKGGSNHSRWYASFQREDNRRYVSIVADTLPQAICEAALAALNGDNIYKGTKPE